MDQIIKGRLEQLKTAIKAMRLGRYRGRVKPHKPILLIAVLDLMDAGHISENRVYFDDRLCSRFERLFCAVAKDRDWCQPAPPFFHLRSSGFWFHKPRPGRQASYAELETSGGYSKRIVDNIAYGFFDPDTYSVVMDREARKRLRDYVLSTFFDSGEQDRLLQVLNQSNLAQPGARE